MPPRDLVGLNILYAPDFYWSYCEFVNNHSEQLGLVLTDMYELSELSEEEDLPELIEVEVDSEGFEIAYLSDSDSDTDSGGSRESIDTIEVALLTGTGTVDDPYDLTFIIDPHEAPQGYLRATPPSSEWDDDLDMLPDLEHFHE